MSEPLPTEQDFRAVPIERVVRHIMDSTATVEVPGVGHALVPSDWGNRREYVRPNRADHMLWEVEEGGLMYQTPDGRKRPIEHGHGLVLPGVLGGRFSVAEDSSEVRVHYVRLRLVAGLRVVLDGPARIGACRGVSLADTVELYRSCEAMGTQLGWLRFRASLAHWIATVHTHAAECRSPTHRLSPVVRRRCLAFIHEHLATGFKLADLAAACNLNPLYLSARFRETFGQSVRAYTKSARMSAARDLLTETALSVGAIAEMAGFCDIYQFCRQFKQVHGVPPGRWRRIEGEV